MTLKPLLALVFLASPAFGQFPQPPLAVDINPDPNIVEVNLSAAETTWEFKAGIQTTVWAFNGSIPGPTIVANVGDTIRVHFTNNLTENSTIHWHGIEAGATVDGSHISQLHVKPGETYTYEWTAINDGMHWYHPHVRTFDQVEKGLYGVIIIRDPTREAALGINTIPEYVVVFDDVLLDGSNEIVPAFSFTDPLQNAIYHLNGREGNLLLVNGKEASAQTLTVPNGEPIRWRVLNSANTTFCRLDLRDAAEGLSSTIWEIGSDQGFINKPFARIDVTSTAPGPDHPGQALLSEMGQGILVLPGERMDVIFTPIGNDGETFTFYQHDWFRGRHTATFNSLGVIQLGFDPMDGAYPKQKFMDLVTQGPDPGTGEYSPPAVLREFPSLTTPPAKGVKQFTFGHGNPDNTTGAVTLFSQAEMVMGPSGMMMNPLPAPKITSFKAHDIEVGDIWEFQIVNLTAGGHPFHVHGFDFELLEIIFSDDVTPTNNFNFVPLVKRMYKDTIRAAPRLGSKGSSRTITRLRIRFHDEGREGEVVAHGELPTFDETGAFTSGGWLTHCHVLEHSGKGMLTFYELRDPADPYHLLGRFLAGAGGNPSLTINGDISGSDPITIEIVDGAPSANVYLAVGNIAANRSMFGGTFVPGRTKDGVTVQTSPLFGRLWVIGTDANGRASFTTSSWVPAPSGTKLYWQAGIEDAGGPEGFAFTNAVLFTRP